MRGRPPGVRNATFIDAPETMNLEGAKKLAREIERYWALRGKSVECRVEPFGVPNRANHYAVRSGMINGMPQD